MSSPYMHELRPSAEPIVVAALSRREQRALLFHLLYVFDSFEYAITIDEVCWTFKHGYNVQLEPTDELAQTVVEIVTRRLEFDTALAPFLLSWRLERLSVAVRLIIRYAFWELAATDLEEKIVINEAIELAKCFGEDDAYKFVNGVLDEAIKGGIRATLKSLITLK